MKFLLTPFLLIALLISSLQTISQKRDTITITANNLNKAAVKYGHISYLVYNKKSAESAATGLYIANIEVVPTTYNNQAAIAITQKWDARDTIAHNAYTVLRAADISTLFHETSWMHLPYSSKFDFELQTVSYDRTVPDSVKLVIEDDFKKSFDTYNLNWHSDLFIFTLLPFKENRSFKIQFYDPGFGKSKETYYDIIGSDLLSTFSGKKIDCWVMEYKYPGNDYQRFWIDKKNKVVLKEEDFFRGRYRYKIKLAVSEKE